MSDVFKNLNPGSHVHLMGICGTAMASLAGILQEMGYKVTGSDQNVYPPMSTQLEKLGIAIMQGYKKENLEPKPDLVIVGNVISRTMPEAEALLASEIPYTSLPKAMGEVVISGRHSLVVSGTHGKTTTTSMMAWVAEVCGRDPGFLIGGIPENFEKSFRKPRGEWFVIEGDEYDTAFFDKVPKFIHYKPEYVIVSSLEFDHADIYNNLEDIKKAFRQLVELVPPTGLIVANADDKNVMDVVTSAKCRVVTYGINGGDYQAADRAVMVGRNQFAVKTKEGRVADLAIKQFGPHNTLNALSVFALTRELGWPLGEVLQGLATFKGVKRRQEIIGEPNGITVIEDFAHHPTAVKLTLATMKEVYPKRKVFAVFEPRSATSRRKVFQQDYIEAFKQADEVILSEPFDQSKIKEEDRFSSGDLVTSLMGAGVPSKVFQSADEIVEYLGVTAKPTDVILLMSNGAFGGIYGKLLSRLS
ncbi:MAG: UDP-N-acetylmuramate:L-alanyl-gamma-D-glutamyl-meso-diaminopimelate ligase [Pseudobdellovibrionaceae bacterium]|nr:UDP-N-acetylmuramate:L-alanyl-gamma-D-glutamyl-meso-diaminopimelate ligase [Bdellovibrionales bacterium]USN48337.1 MAG: UDP-N-acetylmuramate:L-alanyl-gamma-D-glutamyl-meso-diaminopimelate ligase [Pseudobdellovibrionaceae bacterium]